MERPQNPAEHGGKRPTASNEAPLPQKIPTTVEAFMELEGLVSVFDIYLLVFTPPPLFSSISQCSNYITGVNTYAHNFSLNGQ